MGTVAFPQDMVTQPVGLAGAPASWPRPQSGLRRCHWSFSSTEGLLGAFAQVVSAPRWPFSEPVSARSFSALLFKSGKLTLRFQFLI